MNWFPTMSIVTIILAGCGGLPDATQTEMPHHRIGWLERQYKTCDDKECPQPTRKTLAVVELPKTASPVPVEFKPASDPVKLVAEELTVRSIHFGFASSVPTKSGWKTMEDLLSPARTAIRIELHGRTDDVGRKRYNDRLALQRANRVRAWLVSQEVPATIEVRSEGLCCYLDDSHTESARQRNRRVDIRLVHLAKARDAINNSKGAQ